MKHPYAITFTNLTCGQDPNHPHVFLTKIAPPLDGFRCECGAVTWADEVDAAFHRHCTSHHNADFDVCRDDVCARARGGQ